MNERIVKLRRVLKRLKIDSFLVSNPSNIFYLSGFTGNDSLLLLTDSSAHIITDFRYAEEAQASSEGFSIISEQKGLIKKAAFAIKKEHVRRVGFEPYHMTVMEKSVLSGMVKAKFLATEYLVEKLRMVKDAGEIEKIKKAAGIAKKTLKILPKYIKPGVSEKSIADKIDFYQRSLGADKPSFDIIALSGENCSMPHGRPGLRKVKPKDAVLVDFGARVNGYTSDLTRMFFVGKMAQYINIIYSIVSTAQKKAIDKIRPGIRISEIDKAARSYISDKGFGRYFGHATGHGIGIDVHEFPRINLKNKTRLKDGMVFSVEPGIYIPGKLGVRVEDMVLVTQKGCEVITR
jgi:Xaa-Pro aminopeptidase